MSRKKFDYYAPKWVFGGEEIISNLQPVIWLQFISRKEKWCRPLSRANLIVAESFVLPSCTIQFAVYDHSSAFPSISIAYLNTTAIKCAFLIRGDEIDNPLNRSVLRNYVFGLGYRFISHFSNPVPLDFVFLAFALLFHSIPSRRVCFFPTKPPHSAFRSINIWYSRSDVHQFVGT